MSENVVLYGIDPSTGNVYPVTIDAGGHLQVDMLTSPTVNVNNYGWINGAWHKNPLLDGYSRGYSERIINTNAVAGMNTLNSSVVPAGKYWRVQAVEAFNNTSAPTFVTIAATVNTIPISLLHVATPGLSVSVSWNKGEIGLFPGDTITCYYGGCVIGDNLYLVIHAIEVDTNL